MRKYLLAATGVALLSGSGVRWRRWRLRAGRPSAVWMAEWSVMRVE